MSNYITDDNEIEYELISNYLGNSYIDEQLREVQGIAYGGKIILEKNGIYLTSWDNSNIKKTLEVYDNIYNFMIEKSKSITEQEQFEAKIKLISQLDKPKTPDEYAEYAFKNAILGISQEEINLDREKILNLDLARLLSEKAEEFKQALEKSVTTVIGEKDLVDSVKDRFDKIENLL